jgi:hypothetical protein
MHDQGLFCGNSSSAMHCVLTALIAVGGLQINNAPYWTFDIKFKKYLTENLLPDSA